MIIKPVLRVIRNQIRQVFIMIPYLNKAALLVLPAKPIDELSELCLVEFLIRNYKQKYGSDFSVIDIGAGPPPNYYEICLKYTRHVYCVEPALNIHDSPYMSDIKKLIKYSKKGKVNLFRGVISEKTGNVAFYLGKGRRISNSSLDPDYRIDSVSDPASYTDSFENVMVASKTYQEYFTDKAIKNLLFVKIDVEGAEGKVLTTMNKSNAPAILLLEVQYDTGSLKEQIRRLVCEENVFQESLFINKKLESHSFDVLGEYHFNEHLDFLKDDGELLSGSLILARAGIIQKEEILNLRHRIYSSLRLLNNLN